MECLKGLINHNNTGYLLNIISWNIFPFQTGGVAKPQILNWMVLINFSQINSYKLQRHNALCFKTEIFDRFSIDFQYDQMANK